MSCLPVSVLVVAKAPEPGRVKTRLGGGRSGHRIQGVQQCGRGDWR
ncbi:Uncharacterised protein [Mycobacterium tuberculosis]|nr:Uncharacterised protein [Mycobacterium tuberculosis]